MRQNTEPVGNDGPAARPAGGSHRRVSRAVASVAVAAGLAVGGFGIAQAASPSPVSPSPATPGPSTPSTSSPGTPGTAPGTAGRGAHRGMPGFGQRAGALGVLTAVGKSSVTVQEPSGEKVTYTTTADTTVRGDGSTLTLAKLRTGDRVLVLATDAGTTSSSGPKTARAIVVVAPRVFGTVTAVAPGSLTVHDRQGFTRTIATDSATTYAKDRAAATRSAVTVGANINAVGRVDSNGTTLDATKVDVVTKQPGRRGGMFGGRGHGGPGAGAMPGGMPGGMPGWMSGGSAAPTPAPTASS